MYAPAQPDSLAVKSPPSPRPIGLTFLTSNTWIIGEKKAKFALPRLLPPLCALRVGGRRESGAWTAHGHQIFMVNLTGVAPLPGTARDRYSSPARPLSPSLQSLPAENLRIQGTPPSRRCHAWLPGTSPRLPRAEAGFILSK